MKILLISTSSGSRGGGELGLLYLGQALAARGHEVAWWASDHPRMDEIAASFARFAQVHRAAYVNTYDRPGRSFASYLDGATARRVAAEWQALAPDVLHLNKQNLEDGLDLLAAATRSGLPGLAMIHITQSASYLRAHFAPLRDCISRRALRRFPGLLVTTPESRRRDLTEFLGEAPRLRMVHNGVPLPDLAQHSSRRARKRADLGIAEDEILFIALGRMVPQKRPHLFLTAMQHVMERWPKARSLWIGDGAWSHAWDTWVAAHHLQQSIQRLPWQTDASELLAAADVFVHVAEFEGQAFAILEALAAQLPCALTPNLLAELPFLGAENSVTITDDGAWIDALRDESNRLALGRDARRVAETHFSYSNMAAAYEALYHEAVARLS